VFLVPVLFFLCALLGPLGLDLHNVVVCDNDIRAKPCLRRRPLELSRRLLPNEPTKSHQSDDPVIYCWADYERPFVERLWERHGANSKGYAILRGNLVDQCAFVQSHFAMPTHSYSIKAIAPLFGFGWQVDAASGLNSEAWYAEWLATGEERILQKILRYNLDDVSAMAVVDDGLRALVRG